MDPFSQQIDQIIVDQLLYFPEQQHEQDAGKDKSGLGAAPLFSYGFEVDGSLDSNSVSLPFLIGGDEGNFNEGQNSKLAKRKPDEDSSCTQEKRIKTNFEDLFEDCEFLPDCDVFLPDLSFDSPLEDASACQGHCSAFEKEIDGWDKDRAKRALSVDSCGDNCANLSEPVEQIAEERTAEFHFDQIQRHSKLAIAALKRGQYEHCKSIVTWANNLKNKVAHEVKKQAELTWEADKDKDRSLPLPKPAHKKALGSTKRVEQFRKNMRRWMIGTQVHHIGVDWMVYARMEHLQTISRFILGDAMPADPASPSAVAESINMYLQQQLPLDFVDRELAEPEPGKRYAIGQGLMLSLAAKQLRKVPTLAFTMPPESDECALKEWVAQLKALFPTKPAPKSKSSASSRS